MSTSSLPADPGTYLLQLHLSRPRVLTIGRMGRVRFPAGDYAYVGSAFGPGGLRARLGRHLRSVGRPRWHIDALRAVANLRGYCFVATDRSLECDWSQALAALPGARITAPGFGSSDCRSGCRAHLIAFSPDTALHDLRSALQHASKCISFNNE